MKRYKTELSFSAEAPGLFEKYGYPAFFELGSTVFGHGPILAASMGPCRTWSHVGGGQCETLLAIVALTFDGLQGCPLVLRGLLQWKDAPVQQQACDVPFSLPT